jgi:hypothetical protein
MRIKGLCGFVVGVGLIALLPVSGAAWPDAVGPESRRMSRAKDLIADEQWARAIDELRAAVADPKESNKAEALFWLAHSLNQENDFAASVEAIRRLEREHASSPWVKPARSLLIELAQKLRRNDVLWWTAATPPPAPAPRTPPAAPVPPPGRTRRPTPVGPSGTPPAMPVAVPPAVPPGETPIPPPPPPAAPWFVHDWSPDTDQRILALGSLIHTDAEKAIPILKLIALDTNNPGAARRAVFVVAQSRKPQALSTLVEVAQSGPEPVKVAAVRGLGNFEGPEASGALLQVYSSANPPVKRQVMTELGEREEMPALLRIAQSEGDQNLRATAIVTLGRAGGREQLYTLYLKAKRESKRPIIVGLFTARGEDELIRIAETEQDEQLRREVLTRLRLLGTPKARAYIATLKP